MWTFLMNFWTLLLLASKRKRWIIPSPSYTYPLGGVDFPSNFFKSSLVMISITHQLTLWKGSRLFAQYHSPNTGTMKDSILKELSSPSYTVRVVFATVAMGMGMDIPSIRNIIHVGPPRTIREYIQETGRAESTESCFGVQNYSIYRYALSINWFLTLFLHLFYLSFILNSYFMCFRLKSFHHLSLQDVAKQQMFSDVYERSLKLTCLLPECNHSVWKNSLGSLSALKICEKLYSSRTS